jgi:hypothetical protein
VSPFLQVQDAPGLLFAQSREYLALGSVEFVDDLSTNFRVRPAQDLAILQQYVID